MVKTKSLNSSITTKSKGEVIETIRKQLTESEYREYLWRVHNFSTTDIDNIIGRAFRKRR